MEFHLITKIRKWEADISSMNDKIEFVSMNDTIEFVSMNDTIEFVSMSDTIRFVCKFFNSIHDPSVCP